MIPKKIYLNYVSKDDIDKTWSEQPVSVEGCEMLNREYTDLSQVWHSRCKKPEYGNWIIAIDDADELCCGFYIKEFREEDIYRVSGILSDGELILCWDDVARWAYAKDLLPKYIGL